MHGLARRLKSLSRATLFGLAPPGLLQRAHFAFREPSRRNSNGRTGNASRDAILACIEADGFAVLPRYLGDHDCQQAIDEFEAALVKHPQFVHRNEDERIFGAEFVSTVARKFHDDPLWVDLAQAYSGEPQHVFCTMANRISYDSNHAYGSGGCWHRDGFSRELKAIVYLTNTDELNGPFQIIRRSHSSAAILADMKRGKLAALQTRLDDPQVDKILADDPGRRIKITGQAGTAIVFDTSSIHTGSPLRQGRRLAMTNYIATQRVSTAMLADYYSPIIRQPLSRSAG